MQEIVGGFPFKTTFLNAKFDTKNLTEHVFLFKMVLCMYNAKKTFLINALICLFNYSTSYYTIVSSKNTTGENHPH